MRAGFGVLAALLVSGCVAPMALDGFDAAGPALRPEEFFAGKTHGWGVLQTRGGRPSQRFEVTGEGETDAQGRFHLRQTVTWGDGRRTNREWVMTADGANGYRATLTDAKGPVTAQVRGNVFHLRYRLADPAVMMEQYLYLQADGRTVLNTGTVTAMGMPVAHLSEQIVRVAPP
ncbi:MAG: DUF3833 family protein [Polymorphobacter sp.]